MKVLVQKLDGKSNFKKKSIFDFSPFAFDLLGAPVWCWRSGKGLEKVEQRDSHSH